MTLFRGIALCAFCALALAPLRALATGASSSVTQNDPGGTPIVGNGAIIILSWGGTGWSYSASVRQTAGFSGAGGVLLRGVGADVLTTPGSSATAVFNSAANALPPSTTYTIKAWASWYSSAYGTAGSSGTFTTPPAPPVPKRFTFNFMNSSPVDAILKFYKTDALGGSTSGDLESSVTVKAGQMYFGDVSVADGKGRKVIPVYPDGALVSGEIVSSAGGNFQDAGTWFPIGSMATDSKSGGQSVAPVNINSSSTASNVINGSASYAGGTTSSQVYNYTQLTSTTAATNGAIAASTNEIVKAINASGAAVAAAAQAGAGGGGGGGGGISTAGIESRLDSVVTNTGRAYDYGASYSASSGTTGQSGAASSFNSSSGFAAAGGQSPGGATSVTITAPSDPAPVFWNGTMPGLGATVFAFSIANMEADQPTWGAMATVCRSLLLLLMGVWLIRRCLAAIKVYVAAIPATDGGGANNGPENIFPAVVQAKQLAQATVVCASIVGLAVAMIALVDTYATHYGYSVAGILNTLDMTAVGGAYAFVDHFYPVAASLQFGLLTLAFDFLLIPMFLGVVAVIKFVKP